MPPSRGEGLAGIAEQILSVAPPRFALVGFSFGGYLSFESCGRRRIAAKLALIDTSARAIRPASRTAGGGSNSPAPEVRSSFCSNHFNSVHPDNVEDPELMAIHRTMGETNGAEAYVRHQEAIIARPDSRSMLSGIDVPTAIIVGERDAIAAGGGARDA